MPEELYDLIIIGAGPAGLTAAIYAVRQKMNFVVLEAKSPGGQMLDTGVIENYPGFPEGISGVELAEKMKKQAERLGAKILIEEVMSLAVKDNVKEITTASKKTYRAKAVIIATGAEHVKLNVPGEKEFNGKGVSYCATCDGNFFKGKTVAVIGGGNTALEYALYMDNLAKKTYIIHRRDEFRGEPAMVDALNKSKVEKILKTVCKEIRGDKVVKEIVIADAETGKNERTLKVEGVFISVGTSSLTKIAQAAGVELDAAGNIIVDKEQQTNIPGIYAAGDVTGGLRQITISAAGGTIAALNAFKYVKTKFTAE